MTTGEIIKMLREDHGWTQEELGKRVGVNRAAVNKWETGRVTNLKRTTIANLAQVLEVSPIELMGWETPPEQDALTEDEETLLSLFRSMNNEGGAYLLQTAALAASAYKR